MRLFLIFVILCLFYNGAYGKDSLDIEMKLKTLNKPALKTIKSEDGDIIDCIDIYKQHAFDHPALKDHKIEMKPSVELFPNNGSSEPVSFQTCSKSGECPDGTIPVRRVSREEISRASSPSRFGKKTHRSYSILDNAFQNSTPRRIRNAPTTKDRSEAILVALGFNYLGADSDINVWNPPHVQPKDHTSAQIWLFAGLSSEYESVEAGWMANPSLFGDSRARLFTYWTKDSYKKTGCINHLCAGFVQTSSKIALGAAFKPVSTVNHNQYQVNVGLSLDQYSGKWWLIVGNYEVGYWPRELFGVLSHSAIAVQWGGEVFSPNVKKRPHTKTSMGSGNWASGLFRKACFHTNIKIKDYSSNIKFPEYLSQYSSEPNCYSTKFQHGKDKTKSYFYFGGPGQNSRCP